MKDEEGKIVENKPVSTSTHLLKIKAPYIARKANPGQFVMVRASGSLDPILRRPLGIFNANPPYIWLFFEVVGKGTAYLSARHPEEKIHLMGPLGNGFPSTNDSPTLLIAGGRGIVPLFFLLNRVRDRSNISILYGGKSSTDLNFQAEIKALGPKKIFLYTEDGTLGTKGLLTGDTRGIIKENQIAFTLSCGPEAMLAALYKQIGHLGIVNYVSMESYMGCGFGICHSCVISTISRGYQKVCSDGPVFKLEDIQWRT